MLEGSRAVIGGAGVQGIQPIGSFRNATDHHDGQRQPSPLQRTEKALVLTAICITEHHVGMQTFCHSETLGGGRSRMEDVSRFRNCFTQLRSQ